MAKEKFRKMTMHSVGGMVTMEYTAVPGGFVCAKMTLDAKVAKDFSDELLRKPDCVKLDGEKMVAEYFMMLPANTMVEAAKNLVEIENGEWIFEVEKGEDNQ